MNAEVWESPAGVAATLEPVDVPGLLDEWYPESPGARPPRVYRMVDAAGLTVTEFTVFPVEPWSWYDAASDLLVKEGWTPPPPTAEDLAVCEHGLSVSLCAGPGHYPEEF